MPQLKICYIVSTTEGGTWALEQLRDLRNNYDCEVSIVLSGETGKLVDRCKQEGISVFAADFNFMSPTDLFSLPRKLFKLVQFLRRNQFDVIQTHLFNAMVIGRVAGWLADVPVRCSMIAGPFHLEAETPRWVDKATAWMDTTVIPSCEYSRQLYLKMNIPEDRLAVIYYGPDETRFNTQDIKPSAIREEYNWPVDTPLIGMIAYFYPKLGKNRWTPPALQDKAIKGHEDLIHAVPRVLQEFPNAKFLLIGNGWGEAGQQVMDSMKELVATLGLQENIIFTGYRTDIPSIYRELTVSVQASLSENLGGTIEALLMECPTVVTRVGGLVDTVIDGKTGVQVNPSDPSDLARGILSLLKDENRAQSLAKAGRQLMLERFTLRTTVKDLYTLYQEKLSKSKKGYRFHWMLIRFLFLGVFGFFVAIRFFLLDVLFLPYWDQGYKPKNIFKALLKLVKSIGRRYLFQFYASIGRLEAKRAKKKEVSDKE